MLIFLDLDYTLFDTTRYREFLVENNVLEDVEKKYALLRKSDLSSFLYPDTRDFLEKRSKTDHLILATFGDVENQTLKVKQSGIELYFKDFLYTGDVEKAPLMKPYVEKLAEGERAYFLDDRVEQLELARSLASWLVSIRMCRSTGEHSNDPGAEECPRVKDLAEFEASIFQSLNVP